MKGNGRELKGIVGWRDWKGMENQVEEMLRVKKVGGSGREWKGIEDGGNSRKWKGTEGNERWRKDISPFESSFP